MAKKFPALPSGEELFPQLLPWAMQKRRYTSEEARMFCASAYNISGEMLDLRITSNTTAWVNYVAWALAQMTGKELHSKLRQNGGYYQADANEIMAYLKIHFPNQPLVQFTSETQYMPRTTEADRLVVQRIGQDIFREALIQAWNCRCPISGIDHAPLLRASHIKSWACCTEDTERLDVNNGLLLGAHIDAAFDVGLISFDHNGCALFSSSLSPENRERLGLHANIRMPLSPAQNRYMAWHRNRFGLSEA